MGFAADTGYVPQSIEADMLDVMGGVNTQFSTSYIEDNFVGTNYYKYFYALMQEHQLNEIKTAEIFAKLQDYFNQINAQILRPVTTNPGIIGALKTGGFLASVKPMIEADAGKINICVDVDDGDPTYATIKLAVNTIIKDSTVAGNVTQGTEVNTIVLTNGQSFDFKFHLPNEITPLLRLTTTLSVNNQSVIKSPEDQKALLLSNIAARYALGKNFEPQRYFSLVDAPWASDVLLEYSLDSGMSYSGDVYDANYDDLFICILGNVSLVEN